ncbi:MAG TPA: NUDIX domain-containing protein [Candidatus Nanoarchaeia archaeon]|nr:NUDIX domain-containing protein [Candidatus Nanoarchaeia archaeon]
MIYKIGLLAIQDKKFLINKKKSAPLFLMPGGKPLPNESDIDCIKREIKEEHGCKVDEISCIGYFEDKAVGTDTTVRIKLYSGKLVGDVQALSEIVEFRWFGQKDDTSILSPAIKNKILPYLIQNKVI